MITVPGTWPAAATGNHRPIWSAQIVAANGTVLQTSLPVESGQLRMAEGSAPRCEANVDIPTAAAPSLLNQQLLPTGNRLRLSYRIHPDPQAVVMADLDITGMAVTRPDNMITVAAADRAHRVALDDLARGSVPDIGGSTVAAAITALVQRTYSGATVNATGSATTVTVPAKWDEDTLTGSPWQRIERLAILGGAEVFYDRVARTVTVRDQPDIAGTPADTLSVGDGGNLTGYTVLHADGYNTVAALFKTPAGLSRLGIWTDTRATSPVSVQRLGSHVVLAADEVEVDALPSQADVDAAAAAHGRRAGGRARAAELRHPARPWLDPGDTVAVTFLGGPTEKQIIESVGIDLGRDNIQVTRLRNHLYSMDTEVP